MDNARIEKLEEIADLVEKLLVDAYPLQEQFDPESYEVSASIIMRLSKAWHDLAGLPLLEGLGGEEVGA